MPSTVVLNFIYTEKKQIIAESGGEFYLADDLYRLIGGVQFLRFPQKFFGIGNKTPSSLEESYGSELFGIQFSGLRSLGQGFQAGLSFFFENRKMYDLVPGGLLSSLVNDQDVVGRRVRVDGPSGDFWLRPGEGPLLLVAG